MAESASFVRRGYVGSAAPTTLSSGINASVTTITATDLTSWTGIVTNGPARATISDGTTEEEIEFTGVAGNSLTGVTRGVGDTTAASWSTGATLEHTSSKRDFDEANRLVNAILGISGLAAGDLLEALTATTFGRVPKGAGRSALRMNAAGTAKEWVLPATGVDVAPPTGVAATDTANLRAAIAAITSATIQLTAAAIGVSTPALVVPSGHYVINDTLPYGTALHIVSDGRTIIEQTDATKDIFVSTTGYMFSARGVIFAGGKRQVAFGNNNLNTSQVLLDQCEFQRNNSDFMIEVTPTAPATNVSCNLIMRDCKVTAPYKVLHNGPGCRAKLEGLVWVETDDSHSADAAMFKNENELTLDGLYGVPAYVSANMHWVDNYGSVYAIGARFGAEGGGGMPIIDNFAAPTDVFPYTGGFISIKESFLSMGLSVTPYIVRFNTHIPQTIELLDNMGATHNADPYIVDAIAGGAAAYIAARHANTHFYISIRNNQGWAVMDHTGVPAALFAAAARSRVHLHIANNEVFIVTPNVELGTSPIDSDVVALTLKNPGGAAKSWRLGAGEAGVGQDFFTLRDMTAGKDYIVGRGDIADAAGTPLMQIKDVNLYLKGGSVIVGEAAVPAANVGFSGISWSLSQNGHIYFKNGGGTWTLVI